MARPGQQRDDQQENEYIEKLVGVNRVAKVIKGGRRFAFSALMVIGDGNGKVGFGIGKAREVPEAIQKATQQAKRNMIRVPLREGRTLHHDIYGRDGAGRVFLRTAPAGTGIIAGGPMRAIFEAVGIHDIVAKAIGSNNPFSMVNATFDALKHTESPRQVASRRGKKVSDIVSSREVSKGTADAAKADNKPVAPKAKDTKPASKKEESKKAAPEKDAAKKDAPKKADAEKAKTTAKKAD